MNSPLIWCENQIKPIEELLIPATDRIFEHGLGLFETFRTWQGHHSTLNLNLERLRESTRFWQMFVSEPSLPTADNLHALKAANGLVGDAVFRLTATGGSRSQSVVWVQAKPLPAEFPHKGLTLILSNQTVTYHTPTTVYKSINYLNRRLAHDEAISLGTHEEPHIIP